MKTRLDIALWFLHDGLLLLGGGLFQWMRERLRQRSKATRRCARCGRFRGAIAHNCAVRIS